MDDQSLKSLSWCDLKYGEDVQLLPYDIAILGNTTNTTFS